MTHLTTICSIVIYLSLTLNLKAQEKMPKTPDERAIALTEWMKTNLQLTPDQESPVKNVNLKYAVMNEELRNNTKPKMQKVKTLRANEQSRDKELKGILSGDQFKIYESKKEEMKAKFKEEAQARKKQQ